MSSVHLIDAIVRQTVVLIAHLATFAGGRARVGHLADEVFSRLVRELTSQGLSQKVIADMLGMALRTWYRRIRALSESSTEGGRSLWEAVLSHVRATGAVTREDVLLRFHRDDEAMVRAVLIDLIESGLISQSGRGARTVLRPVPLEEGSRLLADDEEGAAMLLWVLVHRFGPVDTGRLHELAGLPPDVVAKALGCLVGDGRVTERAHDGGLLYESPSCVIPVGEPGAFEAAIFDHYQAMVTAMVGRLRWRPGTVPSDALGGSTYTFDLWHGHPLHDDVLGLLRRTREEVSALRQRVLTVQRPPQAKGAVRVMFYAGQAVIDDDHGDNGNGGQP